MHRDSHLLSETSLNFTFDLGQINEGLVISSNGA